MYLALVLGACATPEQKEEQATYYWPMAPEKPRFVFEGSLRTNVSIEKETEAQRTQRLISGADRPIHRMVKPLDVAVRGGRVYVTDTVMRIVHVFDIPRRRYFYMGYRFEGKLTKPMGVAVDNNSNIYVIDAGPNRVVKYDAMGLFALSVGKKGDLVRPTGVAVSDSGDRIYVVDTGGVASRDHRIVVYDGEGNKVATIGTRGGKEGQFNLPVDADIGPDGKLYVLDAGNFRIQVFTPEGEFVKSWGEIGKGFGQFARPRSISVDGDGNVYVGDTSFGNVQVFSSEGRLLLPIGRRGPIDEPGRYRLLAGLDTDETNRLFVVGQFFNKIDILRRLSEEESERIHWERQ